MYVDLQSESSLFDTLGVGPKDIIDFLDLQGKRFPRLSQVASMKSFRIDAKRNIIICLATLLDSKASIHVAPLASAENLSWKCVFPEFVNNDISVQERLYIERRGIPLEGVYEYDYHVDSGQLIFPFHGYLVLCQFIGQTPQFVQEIFVNDEVLNHPRFSVPNASNPMLDCRFSSTAQYIAFTVQNHLYVYHITSRTHIYAAPLSSSQYYPNDVIDYVSQEEFHRFSQYCWKPNNVDINPSDIDYIAYLYVDELNVMKVSIPSESGNITFAYPTPGNKLASYDLRLLKISNGHVTILRLFGKNALYSKYKWMAYITHLQWMGDEVVVRILDRRQSRAAIVCIPIHVFQEFGNKNDTSIRNEKPLCAHRIPLTISSDTWLSPFSFLYCSPKHGYFIYTHRSSSTKFGFTNDTHHLLLRDIKRERDIIIDSRVWIENNIFVEDDRHTVHYVVNPEFNVFTAVKAFFDLATGKVSHVNYEIGTITHVDVVHVEAGYTILMTCHHDQGDFKIPVIYDNACLLKICKGFIPLPLAGATSMPNMISEKIITKYSQMALCLFLPYLSKKEEKYPTILYVYNGPGTTSVLNKCNEDFRLPLMWAACGYFVLIVDGRGTYSEGRESNENCVRYKLGECELEDQMKAIEHVSQKYGYVDTDRVCIYGYSYGGFLALKALQDYPNRVKIAIALSPVSSWLNYDAAYSERYLGLVSEHRDDYHNCSIVNFVEKMPVESHRCIIMHGVLDENVHVSHSEIFVKEMQRHGRPCIFHLFPQERHGVTHQSNIRELFISVMVYLNKHL